MASSDYPVHIIIPSEDTGKFLFSSIGTCSITEGTFDDGIEDCVINSERDSIKITFNGEEFFFVEELPYRDV